MDMGDSTSSTTMAMTPWLHFGYADYLIFKDWRPSSHGAIGGACVGLFLFCIMERCLAAYRRTQESHWRARTTLTLSRVVSASSKRNTTESLPEGSVASRMRFVPPFIPSHDIPRGAIQFVQSAFAYTIMLAVMTFNVAFILSILIGLGVGEIAVGRFGRKQAVE